MNTSTQNNCHTNRDRLSDLVAASTSSLGFWDNAIDDAEWNNA